MHWSRIALLAVALAAARVGAQTASEQLFKSGKYDDARTAFAARLAADKNDVTAMYYLGRIALEQGRSSEAVDWLEQAVKRNDQNSDFHLWLGNALGTEAQKANKFRQPFLARRVKTEFERAVELNANSADAHEGLYEFYSQAPGIMGGSMDKARAEVAKVIALDPPRGHQLAGALAEKEKDIPTAQREYEAMFAGAPDSVRALTTLVLFYQSTNRLDRGFALIDGFLLAHADAVLARYQYGRLAAVSGQNLERGEREMRAFIAGPPDGATPATIATAHWRLGMIAARRGNPDGARAEYREALRIDPKNPNAKAALDTLK
jgi:tetratricopeptide (TPR) repeat protein